SSPYCVTVVSAIAKPTIATNGWPPRALTRPAWSPACRPAPWTVMLCPGNWRNAAVDPSHEVTHGLPIVGMPAGARMRSALYLYLPAQRLPVARCRCEQDIAHAVRDDAILGAVQEENRLLHPADGG